jgi:hypothetical protein
MPCRDLHAARRHTVRTSNPRDVPRSARRRSRDEQDRSLSDGRRRWVDRSLRTGHHRDPDVSTKGARSCTPAREVNYPSPPQAPLGLRSLLLPGRATVRNRQGERMCERAFGQCRYLAAEQAELEWCIPHGSPRSIAIRPDGNLLAVAAKNWGDRWHSGWVYLYELR